MLSSPVRTSPAISHAFSTPGNLLFNPCYSHVSSLLSPALTGLDYYRAEGLTYRCFSSRFLRTHAPALSVTNDEGLTTQYMYY